MASRTQVVFVVDATDGHSRPCSPKQHSFVRTAVTELGGRGTLALIDEQLLHVVAKVGDGSAHHLRVLDEALGPGTPRRRVTLERRCPARAVRSLSRTATRSRARRRSVVSASRDARAKASLLCELWRGRAVLIGFASCAHWMVSAQGSRPGSPPEARTASRARK